MDIKDIKDIKDTKEHINTVNQIKNVVFSGGGILCIAHLGAIRVFEENGLLNNLHGYGGSSAGSIIAAGLACGATSEYLKQQLDELDFDKLKDCSWFVGTNLYRLYTSYGYCEGDFLYEWCGKLIYNLTGSKDTTFGDIYQKTKKYLCITGTDLTEGKTIYFSHESSYNMPIRNAIRISASYPLIYKSVIVNGHIMEDGGILNNYPINIFDIDNIANPHTIGFKLYSSTESQCRKIKNIIDNIEAIIETVHNQALRVYVKKKDWQRTVKINVENMTSMDFSLTKEQKEDLYNRGIKGAKRFLDENKSLAAST